MVGLIDDDDAPPPPNKLHSQFNSDVTINRIRYMPARSIGFYCRGFKSLIDYSYCMSISRYIHWLVSCYMSMKWWSIKSWRALCGTRWEAVALANVIPILPVLHSSPMTLHSITPLMFSQVECLSILPSEKVAAPLQVYLKICNGDGGRRLLNNSGMNDRRAQNYLEEKKTDHQITELENLQQCPPI